uniref:Uncharacterized protein n=1 Tax=Aotus nancymaae TaxID=37293 RepID=A0A2K5EFM7_AOTNA
VFRADDLTIFSLRNFLLFQLWDSRKDSWGPSFSPGAGGCSTTLPATSSTTDSSRVPSSHPPGSTNHYGISAEGTQWCLCILPLRTSQVPDMMAPRHRQEKFHDLAYSHLGKSFSISNQDLHSYSTSSSAIGLTKKKTYFIHLDSL